MRGRAPWRLVAGLAAAAAIVVGCLGLFQQQGPQLRFEPVPFDTELPYITDIAFAPDGSGEAIVLDLYGGFELCTFDGDGATVTMRAALDDVYAEYDAGALAVTMDPGFADNGLFYIAANVSRERVLVRRYTLVRDDPEATVASAALVFEVDGGEDARRWHNVTSMGFDDQGIMWVLSGDKGLSLPRHIPGDTAAQDAVTPFGKLLRIAPNTDPDGAGFSVPDEVEPYSADADPAVVAIGIRSPWKGLHHEGRWIYGDVGLGDYEEINVIDRPGHNFGWPVVEGHCSYDIYDKSPDCSRFTDPWISYLHSNSEAFVLDDLDAAPTNKRSVYAGWIHQPGDPDPYDGALDGLLIFGDAFTGFVRTAHVDGFGTSAHAGHLELPSAWGQAPDGYIYVISLSDEPVVPDDDDDDEDDDSDEPDGDAGIPRTDGGASGDGDGDGDGELSDDRSPLYRVVIEE